MTQQERVQFYRMYEDSREMLNLIAQTKLHAPPIKNGKKPRQTSAQYRRTSDTSCNLFQIHGDDSRFACNKVISQTSVDGNPKQRRRSQSDVGIQRHTTPPPQDMNTHSRRLIKALKENSVESVDISLPKDVKLRRGSAPASQILSTVKEEPEGENHHTVVTVDDENAKNEATDSKMSIRRKLSLFFMGHHASTQ